MFTAQQISEEFLKCLGDTTRVYMIEHFLTTYNQQVRRRVPFKLFPKQKEYVTSLSKYSQNIATKPRQAGITTTTAAFIACQIILADIDSPEKVLIVANKLSMSQDLLQKVKEFVKQAPRWFWGNDYYSPDPKSDANKKDIFVEQNKNKIVLFNGCVVNAVSSGEDAARGISAPSWVIFDEAAFIDNGPTVYSQAVATTATGGHLVMISTPHGKDKLYYDTYNQAKKGTNGYHITELKWFLDPRYNKFLKWHKDVVKTIDGVEVKETQWIEEEHDKDGNVHYDEEKWLNLEKDGWRATGPWYVEMCGKLNNDSQKIAQELDVSFLGSSNNVVDPEIIAMHEKLNIQDYSFTDDLYKETWIWKPPIEGHRYVMSIDASRGDAADSSVIEMLDIDAVDEAGINVAEQVLEYQGKLPGDILGEIAYRYGTTYNNALAIVDCVGGVGDACVLTLQRMNYKNLYYDDPKLSKYISKEIQLGGTTTERLPGFHTSSVRDPMLRGFAAGLRDNVFIIRSKRVIAELETWIYKGANARIDHMDGYHDDTLTCLAMGYFIIKVCVEKLEANIEKDIAILKSWITSASVKTDIKATDENSIFNQNNIPLPFYSSQIFEEKKIKEENKNSVQSRMSKAINVMLFSSYY